MADLNEYDPTRVVFAWGEITITTGWAPDSFIEIEHDEDAFTKQVGAGGEVTRTRNANEAGSVTVRLLQGSVFNSLLSAAAKLDRRVGGGIKPLMIKDLLGNTLVLAEHAWIRKIAPSPFAKEAGEREWVFDCADLDPFVGGSALT